MLPRDRARQFLENQFPDAEIETLDTLMFIPDALLSGVDVNTVRRDKDIAAIETIIRSLRFATSKYGDLSPQARRQLGDVGQKLAIAEYRLTGEAPKFLRESPKGAPSTMPRDTGALAASKTGFLDAVELSPQAERAGTPSKVNVIREARRVWKKYRGVEPPKNPSPNSAYGRFVDKLFEYVGVQWDAESTFRAVKRFEEKER